MEPTESRVALSRLADALTEDVLTMPDEEVLAEYKADGVDPEALAAEMRGLFEQTAMIKGG